MMNLPAELWQTTLIPTDSPELKEPRIDSLDDAFRQALENRMDYLKQSLSEKNLQIDVKYFHNQLKPDLTFKATYTSAGSSYPFDDFGQPAASSVDDALSNAFSIQFPGLNLELALSWTPFQQANKINRSKADVALREHALQTQKLIVQIREEVRDALRALDAARKSLAAFQKSRRYQEQSLQAEIQKFQNGLTTNYQVSEAQDSLTRAVSSEIQSRIELRKQWARLKKAMGVLNEEHGILLE
jgi:outer membrane protein TolC